MNQSISKVEKCFVSAIFHDSEVLSLLERSNLTAEIIQEPFLRSVLEICIDIRSKSLSVDFVSVCCECSRKIQMDNFSDLHDILTAVETSAWAKHHLELMIEDYKRRTVIQQSSKIQLMAKDDDWEENIEKARQLIEDVGRFEIGEKPKTQADRALSVLKDRQEIINGRTESLAKKINTGIPCIDRYCKPLSTSTGDFNVLLFAATSTGKSSLMAQIVSHNVRHANKVAVFLGETNVEGLYAQMAGQLAKVSIDDYDFSNETKERQADYMWHLQNLADSAGHTLWAYDSDFYIEDIVRRSRKIAEENDGLDLVVIDHMHCLKTRQGFKDERLKYNYISGLLKPLGIELNCPVLTLAQPSRGLKSGDRAPMLSDLKESGNLEDDADRIWSLWLPPKDSNGAEQSRKDGNPEIILHQLKFRRGRVTDVRLKLQKDYTLFTGDE